GNGEVALEPRPERLRNDHRAIPRLRTFGVPALGQSRVSQAGPGAFASGPAVLSGSGAQALSGEAFTAGGTPPIPPGTLGSASPRFLPRHGLSVFSKESRSLRGRPVVWRPLP